MASNAPSALRFLVWPGILLLIHASYSAYEHSLLTSRSRPVRTMSITGSNPLSSPASSVSSPDSQQLPLDISIETIASILMICVGLVAGAEQLKPITWRTWAGKAERENGGKGAGPYQGLEDRMGFVDIRAKRKEFADWVRAGQNGKAGL